MFAPKLGLDDAAVLRMAKRISQNTETPVEAEQNPQIRFASYDQAVAGLGSNGFKAVGSALYKRGHALWQLSKSADGYSLMRVAAEPEVFEEDEVKEAPGLHSEEHLKMGSRDRYGVQVAPGDAVHYSLGGEPVVGRVVRAAYGYLDVCLSDQMDSGVPADMVMVDRSRRASADDGAILGVDHDPSTYSTDAKDKESMDMHINPEKVASFMEHHFGSFGAILADDFDRPFPRATIAKMNLLAQEAKDCQECEGKGCEACMDRKATRVASWQSLQQFATKDVILGVQASIKAGVAARRLSKEANVPFAVAYELRSDLIHVASLEPDGARKVGSAAKMVRTATLEDQAFSDLAGQYGAEFARRVASCVLAYRNNELGFQRVAVDQTAEDYWKAYFGEYGGQWVREIKRRVKADLVRASLVKQGADEAAAEYWSNYFGEYGDKLVDEVERSSKKDKVTASRKHSNPTMPLPQPVAKRDIFAGLNIVAEENWDGNRVALTRTGSGVFQVVVKNGSAHKTSTHKSQQDAIDAFRKAVYAHCGI